MKLLLLTLALLAGQSSFAQAPPPLPVGLGDNQAEQAANPTEEIPVGKKLAIHGFWENSIGSRVFHDKAQKEFSLGETRLQLSWDKTWKKVFLTTTTDFYIDAVSEEAKLDSRELKLSIKPNKHLRFDVGRQIITWGTGDLVYINDHFPKDFVSFFAGRHIDYLKAPVNALSVNVLSSWANLEVVYVPQFTPDRFPDGSRFSVYSPIAQDLTDDLNYDQPNSWFSDDELSVRLYRQFGSYDVSLYGYYGYYKSPAGFDLTTQQFTFPQLASYGASVSGPIGKGIFWVETAYYDSLDDSSGNNALIENSEVKLLLGYRRSVAKNTTAAFQYYLEQPLQGDDNRHLLTARITKLFLQQRLQADMFTMFSPDELDCLLQPSASFQINDTWELHGGVNIFLGEKDSTLLGQFEKSSSVFFGARLKF